MCAYHPTKRDDELEEPDPLAILATIAHFEGTGIVDDIAHFRPYLPPALFAHLCVTIAHIEQVVSTGERLPHLRRAQADAGGRRN